MATDSGIDDHSEVGRTQRRAVSRSDQVEQVAWSDPDTVHYIGIPFQDSRLRVQREDQAAAYSSYDRAYEEPAFATYFDGKDTAEDEPNVLKSSAQLDPYDMVLALVFQRLEALDLLQCALVSRKVSNLDRFQGCTTAWRFLSVAYYGKKSTGLAIRPAEKQSHNERNPDIIVPVVQPDCETDLGECEADDETWRP